MNKYLFLFTAVLALYSCSEQADKPQSATVVPIQQAEQPSHAEPEAPIKAPASVTLAGKFLRETEAGESLYQVVLNVDGNTRIIDTLSNYAAIERADFGQYAIPEDAVAACFGWWAGAGDYVYVVLRENRPVVYKGWQDEMQEGADLHWKSINGKL